MPIPTIEELNHTNRDNLIQILDPKTGDIFADLKPLFYKVIGNENTEEIIILNCMPCIGTDSSRYVCIIEFIGKTRTLIQRRELKNLDECLEWIKIQSLFWTNPNTELILKCPICSSDMVARTGKFGKFYSCSTWSQTKCPGKRKENGKPTQNYKPQSIEGTDLSLRNRKIEI